jgi:hypothetical protein
VQTFAVGLGGTKQKTGMIGKDRFLAEQGGFLGACESRKTGGSLSISGGMISVMS